MSQTVLVPSYGPFEMDAASRAAAGAKKGVPNGCNGLKADTPRGHLRLAPRGPKLGKCEGPRRVN